MVKCSNETQNDKAASGLFRIETLKLEQIRELYAERLTQDFPPDELKPLSRIERALKRGEYVCYGATDAGSILAYAFFVVAGNQALFDYFAVAEDLRGRGIGSRFLRALIEDILADMDTVLLEVDDPGCADSAEEASLRTRRLAFYLRNGLSDTGVTAEIYHVFFRILSLPVGRKPSQEKTRRVYAGLYRRILPESLFSRYVVIHGPQGSFAAD